MTDRKLMFVSDRTGAEAFWRVPFARGRGDGSPTMVMAAPLGFWGPIGMTRAGALFYATGASNTNIYVTRLDANGNGASPQSVAIENYVNSNNSASWSPDGSSLAYLSRLGWGGGERAARVTVRTMATGRDRDIPLAVKPIHRVLWFPDGNSLLVTALDLERRVAYYQVDISSGRTTLLTTARGNGMPVHRPEDLAGRQGDFFCGRERHVRRAVDDRYVDAIRSRDADDDDRLHLQRGTDVVRACARWRSRGRARAGAEQRHGAPRPLAGGRRTARAGDVS